MSKVYFTIAGMQYRFGTEFLKKGMEVKLIKEPDNPHDKEAIRVDFEGLGQIGYVANSTNTVKGESYSAGRLYDKIGKKAKGIVQVITPYGAICSVRKQDLK